MRRALGSLVVLAAWLSFGTPADAQESKPPFQPVEFVSYPSEDEGNFCRLALTSETRAEFTIVRGAKGVQGTWSLVAGPRIRFVAPDGAVWPFAIGEGEVRLMGADDVALQGESAWLRRVAADPKRRGRPQAIPVRAAGGGEWTLERHADGQADWAWGRMAVVSVAVEERGPDSLVVRFPDGTSRPLTREGKGWKDSSPAPPRRFNERLARLECAMNLKELAAYFVVLRAEKLGKPPYDGTALFLSWRVKRNPLRGGSERLLICPGDRDALPVEDSIARGLYDRVDLADPTPGLCSYAVRDFTNFPLRADDEVKEPLACCRQGADGRTPHHKGGINVVFDDGSVEFLTAEKLGLASGDPIVVGPDSKSPLLRKLVYIKKR